MVWQASPGPGGILLKNPIALYSDLVLSGASGDGVGSLAP